MDTEPKAVDLDTIVQRVVAMFTTSVFDQHRPYSEAVKASVEILASELGGSEVLPTYSSTQHTKCAVCGEDKHTPLRRDEMGGYVCLTCIDKRLEKLNGAYMILDGKYSLTVTGAEETIRRLREDNEKLKAEIVALSKPNPAPEETGCRGCLYLHVANPRCVLCRRASPAKPSLQDLYVPKDKELPSLASVLRDYALEAASFTGQATFRALLSSLASALAQYPIKEDRNAR